ncbi:MAG: hypothetical protein GY760_09660 [Deltaproteobacteria bacterium]|nr:hypothetical protein [Deltaproteobacteria bacterium]
MGNDLYGMNLFNPVDDARTVSFYTDISIFKDLSLIMDYSVLTDRALDTRIDEIKIALNYPINLFASFYLTPRAGVFLMGNLGGGDIQNALHKLIGIYTVDSIYVEEKVKASLYSSIGISYEFVLVKNKEDNLFFLMEPYTNLTFIPSHLFNWEIGSNIKLVGDNLNFTIGYRYLLGKNLNTSSTLETVNSVEDQGKLYFTMRAGIMEYDLDLFLDGYFASGTF